jgi:hypothetical protein
MTHGKRIPRTSTTKYGPPRWNMIHHIPPSRAHDDSKRKGDIHIDMFSPIKKRPTNVLKNSKNVKNKKIHNLLTYVSLVLIMYQFIYNPRVKSIKMLIFFENPLISSSIHIYPPFFTITDSMRTKTCVNPHTIKKH